MAGCAARGWCCGGEGPHTVDNICLSVHVGESMFVFQGVPFVDAGVKAVCSCVTDPVALLF